MGDEDKHPESVDATILGHTFRVRGLNTVVVVIMAGALACSGWLIWEHTARSTQLATQEHMKLIEAIEAVSQVNEKISELIDEQNYIVLSNDAERRGMKEKLRRPPSLSRKLER